jgi:hypothetical protein
MWKTIIACVKICTLSYSGVHETMIRDLHFYIRSFSSSSDNASEKIFFSNSAMKDRENIPNNKYRKASCLGIKSNVRNTKPISIASSQNTSITTKLIPKQKIYNQLKRTSETKINRINCPSKWKSCRYRAFTVASCAKGWRENHDLILHTSLYCMWYRTYTSELYRQLS